MPARPYRAFNTAPNMVASGAVADINLVSGNYLGAAAKNACARSARVHLRICALIEKRNASQK